jgi:IstB-like ATP binding protein
VLFELIGSRYEGPSMLITANQPFGAWSKVFPDQAMTLAAIDRSACAHPVVLHLGMEVPPCWSKVALSNFGQRRLTPSASHSRSSAVQ